MIQSAADEERRVSDGRMLVGGATSRCILDLLEENCGWDSIMIDITIVTCYFFSYFVFNSFPYGMPAESSTVTEYGHQGFYGKSDYELGEPHSWRDKCDRTMRLKDYVER